MSVIFRLRSVSITDTVPERPQATYSFLPSGVSAMFQGRWPTGMVAVMVWVATSSTDTLASPPFETKTRLPSGCTVMPLLRSPALTLVSTLKLTASIT